MLVYLTLGRCRFGPGAVGRLVSIREETVWGEGLYHFMRMACYCSANSPMFGDSMATRTTLSDVRLGETDGGVNGGYSRDLTS